MIETEYETQRESTGAWCGDLVGLFTALPADINTVIKRSSRQQDMLTGAVVGVWCGEWCTV